MSTVITVPLDKEPDVAALTADMQPGDKVFGCFTIKARDSQTLTLRLQEMADSPDDLPDTTDEDEADDEDGDDTESETKQEETDAAAKTPGKSLAEKLNTQNAEY